MKSMLVMGGVLVLSGCATNSLYFGAYTRVGIDASADGAGIGAKSAAVTIARPKEDGTAFDVIGHSDVDVSFNEAIIHEVVATGEAAKCAAAKDRSLAVKTQDGLPKMGRVIFGSSVSWSLVELNWNNASAPPGLLFGYKRSTGIKLPIVKDTVGSVFADISINTTDYATSTNEHGSKTKGTRSKHTFATGDAAVIRASSPESVERLNGGDKSIKGCNG